MKRMRTRKPLTASLMREAVLIRCTTLFCLSESLSHHGPRVPPTTWRGCRGGRGRAGQRSGPAAGSAPVHTAASGRQTGTGPHSGQCLSPAGKWENLFKKPGTTPLPSGPLLLALGITEGSKLGLLLEPLFLHGCGILLSHNVGVPTLRLGRGSEAGCWRLHGLDGCHGHAFRDISALLCVSLLLQVLLPGQFPLVPASHRRPVPGCGEEGR